jgi:predicted ATPase
LEQGIALHDPQHHRSLAFFAGNLGVSCLSLAAQVLWYLGYPDRAQQKICEALTLAQEVSDPYSLALALDRAATLHQLRREGQAVQERAEAEITLATEQGFSPVLTWGTIMRGWAVAEQGQTKEGIAQMHQGLAAYRATGGEIGRSYYLALLAEVYGKVGQTEEGLSVLAEALAQVDKTGERYHEPELYRLKGQLTLQQFQVSGFKFQVPNTQHSAPSTQVEAEAEVCFHKAIDVARRQQAKSLELRAVMSLSRLWQQQGKKAEARQMLAEIYNWFTEGFDTKDLQEAKALLEQLA